MRLFLAAMPSAKSRDELDDFASQVCNPDDRLALAANLHVTLRFFGEVDTQAVPSLTSAIDATAKDTSQFSLTPKALLAMPLSKPSMLWLEIEEDAALAALCARLLDGIPPLTDVDARNLRHKLRAHFTLARGHRSARKTEHKKQPQPPTAIAIDRICLLQSPASPEDGLYPCLHEAMLVKS